MYYFYEVMITVLKLKKKSIKFKQTKIYKCEVYNFKFNQFSPYDCTQFNQEFDKFSKKKIGKLLHIKLFLFLKWSYT